MQELCKTCAEYGSEFCEECVTETGENTVSVNQVIRNIAKNEQTLGNKNSDDSKE